MRRPKMKKGVLQSWHGPSFDKTGKDDLNFQNGEGCERADARLLNHHLGPLADELEKRGYDLSTFRFEVKKQEGGKA